MSMKVEGAKKKPTILVVDDEAGPRDALKVILRPFFNIQSADNAKAALDVLNTQPIDLVTLDQKLPDRQGIDLLQDIKHDHANIEVIIVTGYGSLKSAMDGIRHGAAGYLLKPFNVSELISLINRTLEKKQRLDLVRNFFRSTPELWGAKQESASAWQALRSSYSALAPCSSETTALPSEKLGLLSLLSDILEATDRQLLNHSSRVSFYATLLGNRLKLTSQEQEALTMGAFLHDIGKTGITYDQCSDHQSAWSVTDASCVEYSERGAHLITSFGLPAEVAQIVAYHHERWDGQDSPHGLRGEGIPLLARIVRIAETFDHLTAGLDGSSPLSIDDAVRQLSLQAHTLFDSKLTDLFSEVVQECKSSLPPMGIAA
ncbi:MAG: response regulator [Nitrospira sp.]|nr:response regulator [Nitrospira sp.]